MNATTIYDVGKSISPSDPFLGLLIFLVLIIVGLMVLRWVYGVAENKFVYRR